MFYRMLKSSYMQHEKDCLGSSCDCLDDTTHSVTTINPAFFGLLADIGPVGLLSLLAGEMYREMERFYTEDFVYAVKTSLLPLAMKYVLHYRRWVTVVSVLTQVRWWWWWWNNLTKSGVGGGGGSRRMRSRKR